MTAEIIKLKLVEGAAPNTSAPVNRVLAIARGSKLDEVLVLGFTEGGEIFARSSHGAADANWLIDQAKRWILDGCPDQDD